MGRPPNGSKSDRMPKVCDRSAWRAETRLHRFRHHGAATWHGFGRWQFRTALALHQLAGSPWIGSMSGHQRFVRRPGGNAHRIRGGTANRLSAGNRLSRYDAPLDEDAGPVTE